MHRWFDRYSRTAPGGANRTLDVLRQILNQAAVWGHVTINPTRGVRRNPRPRPTRFLSRTEIERLHAALDAHRGRESGPQQADIIRLLLLTGCRKSELVSLRWSDVDGDVLHLRDGKTGPRGYRFEVKVGAPPDAQAARMGSKLSRGANFRCVMSGSPVTGDYIKAEGKAGRMGARLMAIVTAGDRRRVYLPATTKHEERSSAPIPEWKPEGDVSARRTGGTCVPYGLTWGDLFTPLQLVASTTFSDLVGEATDRVRRDAATVGLPDDGRPLRDGGTGATAYAEAVAVYLALLINQTANHSSSVCGWNNVNTQMRSVFARQAIPMVVCRYRAITASAATRRELLTALRIELPRSLRLLQTGNIAPVDLAQAAIGPGMAVYTRYAMLSMTVSREAAHPTSRGGRHRRSCAPRASGPASLRCPRRLSLRALAVALRAAPRVRRPPPLGQGAGRLEISAVRWAMDPRAQRSVRQGHSARPAAISASTSSADVWSPEAAPSRSDIV